MVTTTWLWLRALLLAAMIAWGGLHRASGAAPALTPPRLEAVPVATIRGALPAPATWPAVRHARTPRLLVLTTKGTFLSPYQAIARRLHGTLEARYLNGSDARYHVNDAWIEPKDTPTEAELTAYAKEVIVETVRGLTRAPRFDVVFVEANTGLVADPEIVTPLLDYLRTGGVVVVVGNCYPAVGSPLAASWPAAPTKRNSWMGGGATRAAGPELAGVPTERLTGHSWIPIAEAANGGRALATGEAGALFAATVGEGTLLYCPLGPMSRRHDALESVVRDYDHDEIWLRYWDGVLHETCWGSRAFPGYVDTFAVSIPKERQVIEVSGLVVNRSAAGPLVGSVHLVNPLGTVVYRAEAPVTAAIGAQHPLALSIPVAPSWGAGLYRLYFTLGDSMAKKQLHQALGFVAVPGTVTLKVTAGQPGYRIGETARVTVTASSAQPWAGKLALGIFDFRGRLLGHAEEAVTLTATPSTATFTWPVADPGVRVDTFQTVVAAVQDGVEWARAEGRIDKREPWSMRNEYQWSSWSGVTRKHAATVLPAMRLLGHAGFNALGYAGGTGLAHAAERWGWRYYNEGIGVNTFSPVIEYETDAEIEAQVRKEIAKKNDRDLTSPAYVLASVGEEAGFKNGWGGTYYWDTPAAPEKACRAFQWYLKTRYPDLARLNATWHTNYTSWDAVQLTREFSANPDKYLENDGWAHPKLMPPLGDGATGVSLAPFSDTKNFYAWYYDRFIAAAKRIYRETLNPVSLTMASAPSSWIFASRECDVASAGPGGWNESQHHALAGSEAPTFGLIWGHFDWLLKDEDMFWGFLLQRTGHNDYWWDALMFNGDLTHTRSTMALRRWTAQLAGHEPAILDSRLPSADIGLLAPNGILTGQDLQNMHTSLAVALMQGGFSARATTPAELAPYKIVFAVGRQALSAEDAARLQAYVDGGGTLVFTSRFGTQDEFGGAQATTPGGGLAARWGLTTDATLASRGRPKNECQFALDAFAPSLKGHVVADGSPHRTGGFRERVTAAGWTILTAYPDGTPALLTRALGKGKLVYLNAVYVSHHYIQFRTPTDAPRQGFFRLSEWLCRQAGARQTLEVEGELAQTLHLAVKQFTDPTGHIRHVILKNSIAAPWITGRLQWHAPGAAIYDVFTGDRYGPTLPVQFRPNQGRWFAVLERPVKRVEVAVNPTKAIAGAPVRVTVRIVGEDGKAVPGHFPLTIGTTVAGQELPGLRRALSLASGGEVVLPTALNDPAGTWTITVADGITGLTGQAVVQVAAVPTSAPAMRPLGWPSEVAESQQLTSEEFIERLQRLAALYQTEQTAPDGKSWLAKQRLGVYYDWFPGTRHALLRPLYDVDWTTYVPAWRVALMGGATFVLTGEDLGVDPGSGLTIYPHADARQFTALTDLLRGATWGVGTRDGETVIATLGKGRVILCRESIDAAGHTNPEAARWQQRWLAELAAGGGEKLSAPTEAGLRRWWTGEALTRGPRTVSWFGGNQRELTLTVDPAKPLDSVFTLVLPPTGAVTAVDFSLQVTGKTPGAVTLDVGCDDTIEATVATATAPVSGAALLDWPAVVTRYLTWRAAMGGPVSDDNGWRLVPVRLRSATPLTATVREARVGVGQ
jgi:hypothetical protein